MRTEAAQGAVNLRCRQRVTGAINHETCFMRRSGRFGGTGKQRGAAGIRQRNQS